MERIEAAGQAFRKGFNRAHSVLMAFAVEGGLDPVRILSAIL